MSSIDGGVAYNSDSRRRVLRATKPEPATAGTFSVRSCGQLLWHDTSAVTSRIICKLTAATPLPLTESLTVPTSTRPVRVDVASAAVIRKASGGSLRETEMPGHAPPAMKVAPAEVRKAVLKVASSWNACSLRPFGVWMRTGISTELPDCTNCKPTAWPMSTSPGTGLRLAYIVKGYVTDGRQTHVAVMVT